MPQRFGRPRIRSLLAILVIAFCYTNCGRVGTANLTSNSAFGQDVCSTRLKSAFEKTYLPFLSDGNRCNSCHSTSFGSKDPGTAFNSFLSRSIATIDYKAITAHGGNTNSAANQPVIDSFKPSYMTAHSAYQDCKTAMGVAGPAGTDILLTNKSLPVLATHSGQADAGWATLSWQVETEARTSAAGQNLKSTFSIQVRRYLTTKTLGLQFRRPTLTMAAGQTAVQIAGLKILIDDVVEDQITAYEYLEVIVPAGAANQVLATTAVPFSVRDFTTNTQIAVELQNVRAPADSGIAIEPPTTTPVDPAGPGLNLPARITYTELVANAGENNVFARNCLSCHSGGNLAGGLNLASYPAAAAARDSIRRRVNDGNRPMPTAGLMSARSRGLIDVWIASGFPQ